MLASSYVDKEASWEVFRRDIHAERHAEIVNLLPGAEDNVGYLVAGFIRAHTSYPRHVTKVSYFENSTFPNKPELNIPLITQTRAENAANGSAAGEKH